MKRFFVILKNSPYIVAFYSKKLGNKALQAFISLYQKLRIYEIVFFISFLFHRYRIKQFNPVLVPKNLKILFRVQPFQGLTSTREGELIILESRLKRRLFSVKNFLLCGALQKRVEDVVFYTYLTITLELNNPFTEDVLERFLHKKIELLERMLLYVKQINGKTWNQNNIKIHIDVFHRSSLFQGKVIHEMHQAVKQQKKKAILKEAEAAIEKGLYPVLVTVGLSGAYWMRGLDRRIIGLFKPFDEEIHAPNNPIGPKLRGALGLRKTRLGCRVGESPHHEVGAFVVDEFFGFGIVPHTYYASFSHHVFFLTREDRLASRKNTKKKYGSFQEFVSGFVPLGKLPETEYDTLPLDEFQLLVILDVIIGNSDRHLNNILFGDEKIAAIDHGLCFVESLGELGYWYWEGLNQGKSPFFKPMVDLLNNFPFEALEIKLRKKCFISPTALQRMRERVVLLTAAVNEGLVPAQMVELFKPPYLAQLVDLKNTLPAAAAKQVQIYKETL